MVNDAAPRTEDTSALVAATAGAVPELPADQPVDPDRVDGAAESPTRQRVLRVVSERGPVTASTLAGTLELTDTAIRRHLENLLADGLIEPHDAGGTHRGRGRPARAWVLSPSGHQALASDYDHLAGEALRFLADTAGPAAVSAFAERRVAEIEERFEAAVAAAEQAGREPEDRTETLVQILNTAGYAATARPVGAPAQHTPLTGIQVCQGHCPVGHVAAEFPQFCDAETEAFSRMLGVHVQRLATLAHGDHVCTTFVPTTGTSARSTTDETGPEPTSGAVPTPTPAPTKERSAR